MGKSSKIGTARVLRLKHTRLSLQSTVLAREADQYSMEGLKSHRRYAETEVQPPKKRRINLLKAIIEDEYAIYSFTGFTKNQFRRLALDLDAELGKRYEDHHSGHDALQAFQHRSGGARGSAMDTSSACGRQPERKESRILNHEEILLLTILFLKGERRSCLQGFVALPRSTVSSVLEHGILSIIHGLPPFQLDLGGAGTIPGFRNAVGAIDSTMLFMEKIGKESGLWFAPKEKRYECSMKAHIIVDPFGKIGAAAVGWPASVGDSPSAVEFILAEERSHRRWRMPQHCDHIGSPQLGEISSQPEPASEALGTGQTQFASDGEKFEGSGESLIDSTRRDASAVVEMAQTDHVDLAAARSTSTVTSSRGSDQTASEQIPSTQASSTGQHSFRLTSLVGYSPAKAIKAIQEIRAGSFLPEPFTLLADSGYKGLDSFIERPYTRSERSLASLSREQVSDRELYNSRLQHYRVIVELTFGRLKGQFPVLKYGKRKEETLKLCFLAACKLYNWTIADPPHGGGGTPLRTKEDYDLARVTFWERWLYQETTEKFLQSLHR